MLRIVLGLLVVIAGSAYASKPVKRAPVGCVVGGVFYQIDGDTAYRFTIDLDFTPFEGKQIVMKGLLYPGDRFVLDEGTKPVVKAEKCPAAKLRPIRREDAIRMRIAAGDAAKAGDFDKAVELANQAVALLSPADCDSHVDRATVLAQKGDLDAARADLAIAKAKKKCYLGKGAKLNFLLLQDLAKALVDKGDKKSAITALELAQAACDTYICKPDIKKQLDEARK